MDYTGNKYGHLTAVKLVRYDATNRASIWLYRCDCGNERELQAKSVNAGRIRTCGKCELKYKLRASEVRVTGSMRKLYSNEIRRASKEGHRWALSIEDFSEKCTSSCGLCGTGPNNKLRGTRLHFNKLELLNVQAGYTVDNVVAACKRCHMATDKLGIEQTITFVFDVHKHLNPQAT